MVVEMVSDRPVRMPNDQQMFEGINRGIADVPVAPTMADHIGQAAMPDLWAQFRPRRTAKLNTDHDDSSVSHNPQGLGFRLVNEKGLNRTKLHGEQDPPTKPRTQSGRDNSRTS